MSSAPAQRPNPVDQALRLLSMGFSVIPIKARDKRPALASWKPYQDRRATVEEVRTWFESGVDLNIGIVTGAVSGLVVIDGDSLEAVNWLQIHHPSTMRTRTGNGKHYFYRHPGVPIKNNVKLGGMALDVRGDGGYVVAPGSIHPSGSPYEEEGTWGPASTLPMFQPAWLGEKVIPMPKPAPANTIENRITSYLDSTPGAIEGQGGDAHTFRVACKLVRGFNLSDDEALTYLLAWNAKCLPPWAMSDLKVKVQSARANGTEPFGYLLDAQVGRAQNGHFQGQGIDSKGQVPGPYAAPVDDGGPGNLADHLTRTSSGAIKKTPGNLAKILRLDPHFGENLQLNEMSREILFQGVAVPDTFVDFAQEWIEDHHGVAFGREEVAAKVMAQAAQRTMHPVRDWLMGLKWDGEERITRVGREILGCDTPLTTHYLRCTLVGAVRRVYVPGTKLDTCPVLVGDQGIGKSTFWRGLVGAEWFGDSPLDLDSKDGFMNLHRKFCTELAELDHMTSVKAAERVKAFLSSSEDVFRPPFGRSSMAFKRSCFLVGTTNKDAFLVDPTGSRRFWPIQCARVDLRLLGSWREQLWAEARDLFEAGLPHWLDTTQERMRQEDAARFEVEDPWAGQVDLAIDTLVRAGRFPSDGFRISEILTQMGIPVSHQGRSQEMRLAEVLKRKGWKSTLRGEKRLKSWGPA